MFNCPVTAFFCNPQEEEEWSNIYKFVVPKPQGQGSAGKPDGKVQVPQCKRTRRTIRYVGKTRQDRGICFLVSRNGGRLKLAWFGWRARCSGGLAEGMTKMLGRNGVAPIRNGRFKLFSVGSVSSLFKGKINGRKATGVLRFKQSIDNCNSGKVRWTARRA